MNIKIKRVLGINSRNPVVLAIADGDQVVRWNLREGWTCTCTVDPCPHAAAVAAVLHPSVFTIQGGSHA